MGYTHYWDRLESFTEKEWLYVGIFFRTMQSLMELEPSRYRTTAWECVDDAVLIGYDEDTGWEGMKKPEITDRFLAFNGDGENGGESFVIKRFCEPDGLDFCKTNRQPYDVAVTAVLIMLSVLNPRKFIPISDATGGIHGRSWDGGRELYCDVMDILNEEGKYMWKFREEESDGGK